MKRKNKNEEIEDGDKRDGPFGHHVDYVRKTSIGHPWNSRGIHHN